MIVDVITADGLSDDMRKDELMLHRIIPSRERTVNVRNLHIALFSP